MNKAAATAITKTSPIYGLASKFNIEPAKLLEVLRGTVIKPSKNGKPATNEEVAAFCIVAQQYGLNPFTREIHAFASGDKGVVPIVGIDGWTHIVNREGQFDGCEFEDVEGEGGLPDRITCKMYVKDRQHPVCATERFAECKRNTIPWTTMPWRMLRHKAYMQAARYAFGLAGIYDEDEARDIINVTPMREPLAQPQTTDGKPIEQEQQEATSEEQQAETNPVSDKALTVASIITAVREKKGKGPYRIETDGEGVLQTFDDKIAQTAREFAEANESATLYYEEEKRGEYTNKNILKIERIE